MSHRIPTRVGSIVPHEPPETTEKIHVWDLGYYGWLDSDERIEFWDWAFGPYLPERDSVEAIAFLLQRDVPSNFGGDGDEFLLVEGPLSPDEYLLVERYIEYCWQVLPKFLTDRRSRPLSRSDRPSNRRKLVI